MNYEEEAKELVDKFIPLTREWNGETWIDNKAYAKQCALICVQEMIAHDLRKCGDDIVAYYYSESYLDFEQVKEAINKL